MSEPLVTLRLPYYESIPVGTGVGTPPSLIAGYQYFVYSSPLEDPIEIWGFGANFADAGVRVQLAEMNGHGIWTPFFSTPMTAVFGNFTQIEPILLLPAPYLLPPQHKVQFMVHNTTAENISATVITLAGVRLKTLEVKECSS